MPPANQALAVLGASLLVQYDVRYGASAAQWVDQIGGRVLTAFNSPTFGPDGSLFGGLSVYQFSAASSQYLDTGNLGADVLAVGVADLYMRLTWRTTVSGTSSQGGCYLLNSGGGGVAWMFRNATGWIPTVQPNNITTAQTLGSDLTVHSWEWGVQAGTLRFRSDRGAVDLTSLTGKTLAAAVRRIEIAGSNGPAFPSDMSVAQLLVCDAWPSAGQLAALDAADFATFGIP